MTIVPWKDHQWTKGIEWCKRKSLQEKIYQFPTLSCSEQCQVPCHVEPWCLHCSWSWCRCLCWDLWSFRQIKDTSSFPFSKQHCLTSVVVVVLIFISVCHCLCHVPPLCPVLNQFQTDSWWCPAKVTIEIIQQIVDCAKVTIENTQQIRGVYWTSSPGTIVPALLSLPKMPPGPTCGCGIIYYREWNDTTGYYRNTCGPFTKSKPNMCWTVPTFSLSSAASAIISRRPWKMYRLVQCSLNIFCEQCNREP